MIEDEQARPAPVRGFVPPATLDGWGVQALQDYIAALRGEIARAEAALAARESHRSAADALFRKP